MFKLVLCVFFAAAAASPAASPEPNPDLYQYTLTQSTIPLTWAPGFTRTAKTVITHQTPLVYSHLIKKRSAQLPLSYLTPSTYWATNPLATTYSSPLIHNAQIIPSVYSTAHLIKKRSAALIPAAYSTAYSTPLITSYASSPIISPTPLFSSQLISQPLTYTHFIKK